MYFFRFEEAYMRGFYWKEEYVIRFQLMAKS
jgi:hypothetical protein